MLNDIENPKFAWRYQIASGLCGPIQCVHTAPQRFLIGAAEKWQLAVVVTIHFSIAIWLRYKGRVTTTAYDKYSVPYHVLRV